MAEKPQEENMAGQQNMLTLEAQKELVDYNYKKAQAYTIKTLLIVIPTVLFLVAGIISTVFFLTGFIHF